MTARAKISELEEISSNGWPAREVEYIGGWKLRANDGVTRRANSVLPLADPKRKLDDAVDAVEQFYEHRGIVPRFQVTEASAPRNLDSRLVERGYVTDITVRVQTTPLRNLSAIGAHHSVEMNPGLTAEWLSTYATAGQFDEKAIKCRADILERINAKRAFALARISDNIVGVGVGVVEQGWLGLFAIETLVTYRRAGVATSVIHSLGAWGKENGARVAYLQVEAKNMPALALYEEMGFKDAYHYWSRTKTDTPKAG
jgi:GNAT superfamily N-acetyltransferase